MRYYKIYNQSVRTNKRIQEITKDEAYKCIDAAVDLVLIDAKNTGLLKSDFWDDEENNESEKYYNESLEVFDRMNFFICGDYNIQQVEDPEELEIINIWTSSMLEYYN